MEKRWKKVLYWAPRVLGIIFVLITIGFAFGVFPEVEGFWKSAGAFIVQMVPALIVGALLIVAWKWEKIGGAFIPVGLFYLWRSLVIFEGEAILLLPGMVFAIGILFLVDYMLSRKR